MLSAAELLDNFEKTRGNLCPGKLLGIRMAALGCKLVGIDDPVGFDRNKLIVWIEIDRWLAETIEAVTGVSLGKRNLKFFDYGKVAATFLNTENGDAVRIVALESSRELANKRHPEIESKHLRQMTTYREASDEDLFGIRFVNVELSELDAPGHPRSRVICSMCGEGVNDGREVVIADESTLCQPCGQSVLGRFRSLSESVIAQ